MAKTVDLTDSILMNADRVTVFCHQRASSMSHLTFEFFGVNATGRRLLTLREVTAFSFYFVFLNLRWFLVRFIRLQTIFVTF